MAEYIFRTQETHWVVYKMDIPNSVTDIDQYFYDNHTTKDLIGDECYEYQLDEVIKVEPSKKAFDNVL